MTSITQEVCKEAGVKPRDAERSKNFFALGLVSWLYTRPDRADVEWIAERFADQPQVAEANTRAFRAGFDFGETAELFESNYEVRAGHLREGRVRPGHRQPGPGLGPDRGRPAGRAPPLLGELPDHPGLGHPPRASRRKEFGVRTFQAEDEIAGIGAALGAAFGGALGVTTTSGPGSRPQVRDHRPGHQPRAPAGDRRRPTGRALHRAADQDRAGRPAPRHVRPPRRGAAADRGGHDPRATASTRPSRPPGSPSSTGRR